MTRSLTPAAARAAAVADGWNGAIGSDPGVSTAAALLMALALQRECRAAELLSTAEIDAESIARRWPGLASAALPVEAIDPGVPSRAIRQVLHAAEGLFDEFSQPEALATEHLLLGIAAGDSPVAAWLGERGLTSRRILAEIERLQGVDRTPLAWDEEPVDAPDASPAAVERAVAPIAEGPQAPWRILDAASNRAREALRVLEDLARFGYGRGDETEALKRLRHELAAVVERFPAERLLAARDAARDVGAELSTPREASRADFSAIAAANFKRAQEALRSLEEFSKLVDSEAARDFERLRFRVYALESQWIVGSARRARLSQARLYVLLDGRESLVSFERMADEILAAGADVVQLRDKRLTDAALAERAAALVRRAAGGPALAIINDRADVAVACEADGAHVGQDELPVDAVRRVLGADRLVGLSTHSIEQARQALSQGADYIGVGPVYSSTTKSFETLPGLELVRAVMAETPLPAFAIGGIDRSNLDAVLAAGATRIAVSGAVLGAGDPGGAVRALRAALSGARGS